MDKDSYPPSSGEQNFDGISSSTNLAQSIFNSDSAEENSSGLNLEENEESRRHSEEFFGDENEIVVDDDNAVTYQDEVTGIKIKYTLTPDEIKEFVHHSKAYEKCGNVKRTHTVLQSLLFTILISMACISGSLYYVVMSAFPLIALGLMWVIPFLNIKAAANKLYRESPFMAEIFPDKIEVESRSGRKTLFLNDMCESIESKNMIMIFTPDSGAVIPLRSVEPELRADIQAIVAAGTSPINKKLEKDRY